MHTSSIPGCGPRARVVLRSAVAAAALAAAGAASAAITTYSALASMSSATVGVSTDSFNALTLDYLPSITARAVGSYTYSANALGGLYGAGSSSDVWLSTSDSGASITFNAFTGPVRAFGGLFFGSDVQGAFLAGQTITLTATDSTGATATTTISNATTSSFAGFVSTGNLTSVVASIADRNAWLAVNNAALGGVAPVPEPGTWAMALAGVASVIGVVRRRRQPGGRS